jgi:flagellar biosynthesis/type III secretory pathway chaperone
MSEAERRRLENLLDREIDIARLLGATLDAERIALTGTSPEAVGHEAAEKVQLLGTLEKLEDERRALAAVAQQGLPGARLAKGAGIAPSVAERWRLLMELMAACHRANEVNGYIINLRQGQIQQLLGVIRGGAPLTYSSQGRTSAKALRALARA